MNGLQELSVTRDRKFLQLFANMLKIPFNWNTAILDR